MSEIPDPSRRTELLHAKLGALVKLESNAGATVGNAGAAVKKAGFPDGAIQQFGDVAYFLLESATERSLGPVLIWAQHRGVDRVVMFVTDQAVAENLARKALGFDLLVSVRLIEGATTTEVAPAPLPDPASPPTSDELKQAEVFGSHGLETVVEWGVVTGELAGLEVARVEPAPELRVITGVGEFDREIAVMMRSGETPDESVKAVVASIGEYRQLGVPPHPMRDLVVERWQRSLATANPNTIGLTKIDPVDMTLRRTDLRSNLPAASVDRSENTLVVFTAGIDLDLLPAAWDTAEFQKSQGQAIERIMLVGDEGCFHSAQRGLAHRCRLPVSIVEIPAPNSNN